MTLSQSIIEIFENYLEDKGIEIDNPEREQSGENACQIYGTEYGDMEQKIDELILDYTYGNTNELITIEEFVEQVWNVERVKIAVNNDGNFNHLVRPYNYSPLPSDSTVDDLKQRIDYCINRPFRYYIDPLKSK